MGQLLELLDQQTHVLPQVYPMSQMCGFLDYPAIRTLLSRTSNTLTQIPVSFYIDLLCYTR